MPELRTAVTDARGNFSFSGGLSGEYALVAFEALRAEALVETMQFIDANGSRGVRVRVNPAGSTSIPLRALPSPDR